MSSEPQNARGRHAKPPSKAAVIGERALDAVLSERHRRKLWLAGGGTVSALALAVVTAIGLPGGGGPARTAPAEAAAATRSAAPVNASPAADRVTAADSDEDLQAIDYLKRQDPGEKVVKHVEEVRQSGDFLRVYTDLPEEDENSKTAVSLCEWSSDYLKSTRSDKDPIVFIHAKESDNGHVVLANKDSAKDNCKVGETR